MKHQTSFSLRDPIHQSPQISGNLQTKSSAWTRREACDFLADGCSAIPGCLADGMKKVVWDGPKFALKQTDRFIMWADPVLWPLNNGLALACVNAVTIARTYTTFKACELGKIDGYMHPEPMATLLDAGGLALVGLIAVISVATRKYENSDYYLLKVKASLAGAAAAATLSNILLIHYNAAQSNCLNYRLSINSSAALLGFGMNFFSYTHNSIAPARRPGLTGPAQNFDLVQKYQKKTGLLANLKEVTTLINNGASGVLFYTLMISLSRGKWQTQIDQGTLFSFIAGASFELVAKVIDKGMAHCKGEMDEGDLAYKTIQFRSLIGDWVYAYRSSIMIASLANVDMEDRTNSYSWYSLSYLLAILVAASESSRKVNLKTIAKILPLTITDREYQSLEDSPPSSSPLARRPSSTGSTDSSSSDEGDVETSNPRVFRYGT